MVLTGRAPGNLPPPSRPLPQSLLPSLNCYLPHFCCSFPATRRQGACERERTRSPVEACISPLRQLSARKTKSKRKGGGGRWGWGGGGWGGRKKQQKVWGGRRKKKLFFHRFLFRKNNLSGRRSPFNDLQLHADNSSPAFRFIPSP